MRPSVLVLVVIISCAALHAAPLTPVISAPPPELDLFESLDATFGAGSGAGPGSGAYTRLFDDSDMFWRLGPTSTFEAVGSFGAVNVRFGVCMLCNGTDDILFSPSISPNTNSQLMLPLTPERAVTDGIYRLFTDSIISVPELESSVGVVYSDPFLNPLGFDHMVSFQLSNAPTSYVVAFEDWFVTSANVPTDLDYNDVIIQLKNAAVQPVPEPGSLVLMASGLLLGLGLSRRRRSKSC